MMSPNISISLETLTRLQAIAVPLVDTYDSVIQRAVDALEKLNGGSGDNPPSSSPRAVNPSKPPNLSFTTIDSIVFNGKALPPAERNWNLLLRMVIQEAKKSLTTQQVSQHLLCNHVVGEKSVNGYIYLPAAGLSVQGQDANNAWKATYQLLQAIKVPVEVKFTWQDNPKAVAPGESAKLSVEWH